MKSRGWGRGCASNLWAPTVTHRSECREGPPHLVHLRLVRAHDAVQRLRTEALDGRAIPAERVGQEDGPVASRRVVVEQHRHVESLQPVP